MTAIRKAICAMFGHAFRTPAFSEKGAWLMDCARCGYVVKGNIPPQHQHVLGNKKHDSVRGYHYACACGHWEVAPDPVKRAKKDGV